MSIATAFPRADTTGEPAPPAIEVTDLAYRYADRVALDGVSLSVPSGSIFGLLGPNGSGKSTLLSLLIGRRAPAKGRLRILDQPPSDGLRRRLGIVFQEPSLDPRMTVAETMRLHARLFGVPRDLAADRTTALLRATGLSDRASAYTATLSGGMRRRLELARALIPAPELLLLDEPTLALDPDSRQRLWQHLLEANAGGLTLLVATNDVLEAERYCRAVALLDHGRVVAHGAPADLKRGLRRDAVRIGWKDGHTPDRARLQALNGAGKVRISGQTAHVTVDDAPSFLAQLFRDAGEHVHSVRIEESTLEDVYFQLVGHGMTAETPREEPAP